ncbi:MAG TPA: L,D-transpeptidase [Candidatus Paceibacterota bacterium]|nr:L,D-transpeptidase [Candidatus Paceibacterota bacterium]
MRSLKNISALVLLPTLLTSTLAKGAAADYDYLLLVEISSKTLILYQLDGDQKEIKRFPVATPLSSKALPLPLIGTVTKIEINPAWYPTSATRSAYLKKYGKELPAVIRAGDPRNAMGKAQLVIAYTNKSFHLPIRIHGNNDRASIGKKATRGCIRMLNEDILTLIEIIKNHRTQVIMR